MCEPGEFKCCQSGSGPKPAVLAPAAQDLPWPWTSWFLGSAWVHSRRWCQKVCAFAKSLNMEKLPSPKESGQKPRASPLSSSPSGAWVENQRPHFHSLLFTHLSPNKCESRQCQLPRLLPNNLVLCRLARVSSTQGHVRLSLRSAA